MSSSNATDARLGWVDSPNGRGTIDIIWGCILTVFLCVWTVLALNVPARNTSQLVFACTKMKWAVIALFGPEMLSAMAGAQWSIARRSTKLFQNGGVPWTIRQSFFAEMGGVRLKLRDDEFPLTSEHIYVLFKRGLIDLDSITTAAIDDRSKADGVAKLFTIVQTGWFVFQCLARLKQHISITTLELSTVAFVVCTIGTNIMWWAKPKDVFVPIVLKADHTLEGLLQMVGTQILDAKEEAASWKWSPLEKFDDLRPNFLVDVGQYLPRISSFELSQTAQKIRFRNDRLPPQPRDWLLNIFLGLLSLSFGAVYVAGWNISFATKAEQLVWRICSLIMFNLIVAYWAVDAGVELYQKKIKNLSRDHRAVVTPFQMALYTVISAVYIATRICILVEPFVGLRSLPVGAFETVQWTAVIPHV